MNGLMMNYSLTLDKMLTRANTVFPSQEIVSRLADGSIHRYTYKDFYKRVLRLMNALRTLGVKPGDRVATFAWNNYRHMEIYFAVPALGAVLHTLNIKLFPESLTYIVNHAEDKFIFVDKSLVKPLAALQDTFKTVENYIIMDDKAAEPDIQFKTSLDYENLINQADETESFIELDENTAAGLCYTSGTTGEPKGALYSHRSMFLHAVGICMTDTLGIGARDAVLPVVPMFHVNAWGIPFACCLSGAKPVFPGPGLLGKPIAELIEQEKVTIAAGVPTIWNLLYHHLKKEKHDVSSLKSIVVGGSAVPEALIRGFQKDFGLSILHAWGMTETSPVGTVCNLLPQIAALPEEERFSYKAKQGLPAPMVELRIVDDKGNDVVRDGKASGELLIRGPWVVSSYFNNDSESARQAFTEDGWFRTGDVASIDPMGYMQITDRVKDLIKTRGEWLSSVEMENLAMSHPSVLEATVVGRADDVRGEAPVLFVVVQETEKGKLSAKEVYDHLSPHFAHWQLPKISDIHFIESIPKTSVGKFDKKVLRKQLQEG